jgi:hypothetical protein
MCGENDLRSGTLEIGFYTATKLPLTLFCLCRNLLPKMALNVFPHPPYSPDVAPCDIFLFSLLKLALKGSRFDDIIMIQKQSEATLVESKAQDF